MTIITLADQSRGFGPCADHDEGNARADGDHARNRIECDRVGSFGIDLYWPSIHHALSGKIRDALKSQRRNAQDDQDHSDDS
jgi:hypothetical protein